jgi:hypothetical protein
MLENEENSDKDEKPVVLVLIEWFLIILVIGTLIGFSLKIMF